MVSQEMLRFRRGDLLAVAFVLLLAAAVAIGYLPKSGQTAECAEVYRDGELIRIMSLEEDQRFTIEAAYTNVIEVRDGKIGVAESDCPGADCVHSGFIGKPNRSIVCLPNAVELRIVADEADVDFVVR